MRTPVNRQGWNKLLWQNKFLVTVLVAAALVAIIIYAEERGNNTVGASSSGSGGYSDVYDSEEHYLANAESYVTGHAHIIEGLKDDLNSYYSGIVGDHLDTASEKIEGLEGGEDWIAGSLDAAGTAPCEDSLRRYQTAASSLSDTAGDIVRQERQSYISEDDLAYLQGELDRAVEANNAAYDCVTAY